MLPGLSTHQSASPVNSQQLMPRQLPAIALQCHLQESVYGSITNLLYCVSWLLLQECCIEFFGLYRHIYFRLLFMSHEIFGLLQRSIYSGTAVLCHKVLGSKLLLWKKRPRRPLKWERWPLDFIAMLCIYYDKNHIILPSIFCHNAKLFPPIYVDPSYIYQLPKQP